MKIARKRELARRKRKKQKKNLAKRGRTVAKEGRRKDEWRKIKELKDTSLRDRVSSTGTTS